MNQSEVLISNEVGRYLARVRENAGLKQVELARQTTISAAVLSRIENGERSVDIEELENILKSIATEEALGLIDIIKRKWEIIPRPPLGHPDQDLLWRAERVSANLEEVRKNPGIKSAFSVRLAEYLKDIRKNCDLLINTSHQVAFIGSIGIGKTTAICKLTGMELSNNDGSLHPVLEAGAGGITICEVHLKSGPEFGVFIEPRSEDEIRSFVFDFAESLHSTVNISSASIETLEGEGQGISKEVERAIRNMAGLKRRKEKNNEGKIVRVDEAKLLASEHGNPHDLAVEIISRMGLYRRDARNIWYDADSGAEPLIWLKEMFERINNGRHQGFTLPKRIEIFVPRRLVSESRFVDSIIDTKGIDRTSARADLENLLDDPHTLSVLCSGFNNAPAAELRLLLERAKDANISDIELRNVVLVLPRPDEAMAVKDEAGLLVENVAEGYELKREQIELSLAGLIGPIGIEFFNSRQEDPNKVAQFINNKIDNVRGAFRSRLSDSIDNVISVIENHEREQIKEVIAQVEKTFDAWIKNNKVVSDKRSHVEKSLTDQIASSSGSTIHASVRREGDWYNLSYSHHLGYGARRVAVLLLSEKVKSFSSLCRTLETNQDYSDAAEIVKQAEVILNAAYEDILKKAQLVGRGAYSSALKSDSDFWQSCIGEWGTGVGYRDRVVKHNNNWFSKPENREIELSIRKVIEREWENALLRVSSIFDLK